MKVKNLEWFEFKIGVKQGYVLFGLLILMVVDWIMKITEGNSTGMSGTFMSKHEDLDFVNGIILCHQATDICK